MSSKLSHSAMLHNHDLKPPHAQSANGRYGVTATFHGLKKTLWVVTWPRSDKYLLYCVLLIVYWFLLYVILNCRHSYFSDASLGHTPNAGQRTDVIFFDILRLRYHWRTVVAGKTEKPLLYKLEWEFNVLHQIFTIASFPVQNEPVTRFSKAHVTFEAKTKRSSQNAKIKSAGHN